MSSYTQPQSLCQLVLTRMKERPLVENAALPHTETKKLAHPFISFSSKSMPLPELVQRRSVLFLFQINFVYW